MKRIKRSTIDGQYIHVSFIPPEHWWQRAKWELLAPIISHNAHIIVPEGFISDGASVPWPFRWLFSPTGEYFCASIIHDYIIVTENNWTKANEEFETELRYINMNETLRWIMISAVKIWAKIKGN